MEKSEHSYCFGSVAQTLCIFLKKKKKLDSCWIWLLLCLIVVDLSVPMLLGLQKSENIEK